MDIEFNIPCDSEGYVAFECPFCEVEFKLLGTDFQKDEQQLENLFCPYCGLSDSRSNFFTKDQVAHMQILCQNYAIQQINNAFGKMAKSMKSNKHVKVNFTADKLLDVDELKTHETVETVYQCKLCEGNEKILHSADVSKIFCSFCGVDI